MGKRFKVLFTAAAAAAVCFIYPSLPVHADEITDNLALIAAVDENGELVYAGSGFFLETKEGIVLIGGAAEELKQADTIGVIKGDGSETQASLEICDSDAGVAVFGVSDIASGLSEEAAVSFSALSEGETLIYFGLDWTKFSQDNKISDICVSGQSSIGAVGTSGNYTFIQMADTFDSMYAGGPVFTQDGYIAGVLSAKGNGFVLPMDYLVDLSSEQGGGQGSTNGQGGSGGQGSTDGQGGGDSQGSADGQGGAGGQSGTGGNGQGGAGSQGGGSGQGNAAAPAQSGSPVLSTYFIVLVSVCGIAFIASLITYMNREMQRKARGQEEFPDMPSDRPSGAAPGGVLKGVGGYFSGRTISLSSGPVIFGRDAARCTAVYPENTRGVSGRHCKVELTGQGILLTDLGSTYGTFLGNGQKLAPNTPVLLRAGERFYLAEQANTFEII